MADQVTMYRSTSANVYETEFEADRDNFRGWLIDNCRNLETNVAANIVSFISSTRELTDATIALLQQINTSRPIAPPMVATTPQNPNGSAAPLPPMPADGYPVPDLLRSRVHCMGMPGGCSHPRDECTADPDYQRWIKAVRLYEASDSAISNGLKLSECSSETIQTWLHKAKYSL